MLDLHISIGEVSRLVGVSPATLRAWERSGLVAPDRSPAGYRRYTLADVERLRRIRRLREVDRLGADAIRAAVTTDGEPAATPDGTESGRLPDWVVRLHDLRQRQGLSLRRVGERTGLSPSFISGIERGLANASVAVLQRLTSAYGTSIVELMGTGIGPELRPSRGLVRVADRQRYDATAGVTMEQLNFGDHAMELHLFTVEPGGGTGGTYQHGGEEFIFLMAGELEVWIDAVERYALAPGDVLYFESLRPHEWTNAGTTPAVFLGVNTPRTF